MDLSWWGNYDDDYWHDLILHVERENYYNKDEETLKKLFCDRECIPQNVIGIMNVPNKNRMDELVEIAKETCNIDNALLVFKTNSTGKNQLYFDEVHAYFYNGSEVKESKMAKVSEIMGTLYMHFEQLVK